MLLIAAVVKRGWFALGGANKLDELSRKYQKSEDTWMPGYPHMSPVTKSFFTFWVFFDLRFGIDKETIGTCILYLNDILQIDEGTIELIKNLQSSKMGIYTSIEILILLCRHLRNIMQYFF
jgi:hypothetical protein